jgi:membrane protein implicated in regulation of membrane protease activity
VNTIQFISNLPAYALWLSGGIVCLSIGLTTVEPIFSALGLAALITSIASLLIPSASLQLMIWGLLAVWFSLLFHKFVPKASRALKHSSEAAVSSAIPSGGVGEVEYEGSLWSARCQISDVAIASGHTVQVVARQGNTLIVLPHAIEDWG